MKTINKICWILAMVFGVGAIVLFFTNFATIVSAGEEKNFVGAALAFGADGMAKSADILFCFILSIIGLATAIFSFKSKGARYCAPAISLIAGIYMLVIALSDEWKFVDKRPLPNVTSIEYGPFVIFVAIALLVAAICAVAYLLIDDYIEVVESKGAKLTIPKRIVRFFRDYKSEVKKIVWPGIKDVVKNTLIVLIICLIIGAMVWLVDFGLGQLLELILGA